MPAKGGGPPLLDTNVLIALLWPAHEAHAACGSWFAAHAHAGWATCPITEAGFVRIVSNPAFSRDAPRAENALDLLVHNLRHPAHRFWPDSLPLEAAARVTQARLFGHRQVTDAYLLALAMHRHGRLVTLDGGVRSLLPPAPDFDRYVEHIS